MKKHYPNVMRIWHQNWDAIALMFKFSAEVRKVIYTTNVIESLNSTYRRLNRQRSIFTNDTVLLKVLYLATFESITNAYALRKIVCNQYLAIPPLYTDFLIRNEKTDCYHNWYYIGSILSVIFSINCKRVQKNCTLRHILRQSLTPPYRISASCVHAA